MTDALLSISSFNLRVARLREGKITVITIQNFPMLGVPNTKITTIASNLPRASMRISLMTQRPRWGVNGGV